MPVVSMAFLQPGPCFFEDLTSSTKVQLCCVQRFSIGKLNMATELFKPRPSLACSFVVEDAILGYQSDQQAQRQP